MAASTDLQLLWPQIYLQPVSLWFYKTLCCWMVLVNLTAIPISALRAACWALRCKESPRVHTGHLGSLEGAEGGCLREKRRFAQSHYQLFAQLFVHHLNNTVKEAAQMRQCRRHLNHAGLAPPRPRSHRPLQQDAAWTVPAGAVPHSSSTLHQCPTPTPHHPIASAHC